MEPAVVVGLGNPGPEYESTRHNVGFFVVDHLAGRWNSRWKTGKGDYLTASKSLYGRQIILVKPLTFMNNSGAAVAEALQHFEVPASALLLVVDDLALPLGSLRLRPGGSDGGHNGLASVIEWLGSDQVARLRCGIGNETMQPGSDMAEFVLSPFDVRESDSVQEMVARGADAVTEFACNGIASAMNRFNT